MFTKQHVRPNRQMLEIAQDVTAKLYDYDRETTPDFHRELKSKVFDALVGFDATKE